MFTVSRFKGGYVQKLKTISLLMDRAGAYFLCMFLGRAKSMHRLSYFLCIFMWWPVTDFFTVCFVLSVILPICGTQNLSKFSFMFALFMLIIIVVQSMQKRTAGRVQFSKSAPHGCDLSSLNLICVGCIRCISLLTTISFYRCQAKLPLTRPA
jgi:predicted Kef-type K+ transport protein